MADQYDLLIKNGMVFDGSGSRPVVEDLGIAGDCVVARGPDLDPCEATQVIDAQGKWVTPGLLDIHTHLDLEVEFEPGLKEVVRHGTTTVLMSNCSLGMVYGNQRRNGEDPIVDCFARVENMPKKVLRKAADRATWQTSREYYEHLDALPLGCNVIPMIPHSMLRTEVMGIAGSVTRPPTEQELERMEGLVELAMQEGYIGFSTDALPFHYLAEDPNRKSRIPSQHVEAKELKRITDILRAHGRLWQATPAKDKPLNVFKSFLLTSGRLHGKPLKITAVAALDIASNRTMRKLSLFLTWFLNKPVGGQFRFQALAAPFLLFWDGPINPLAEEIGELRELNEFDLEDSASRRRLLRDPAYRRRFTRMWMWGKRGGLAGLKKRLALDPHSFDRELSSMTIVSGGPDFWQGQLFSDVFERYRLWLGGGIPADLADDERHVFEALAALGGDAEEANFMLAIFDHFDTRLRWSTVSANRDPKVVKAFLEHPQILPGFNDSGAHITNMAFYDGNLRCLKFAQEDGIDRVAKQVARLTCEPADFLGVEAGRIAIGGRADIVVIDPARLAAYDPEENLRFVYREDYEHEQLVNRSDGVVKATIVGGKCAWLDGEFDPDHGRTRMALALRHRDHQPHHAA